ARCRRRGSYYSVGAEDHSEHGECHQRKDCHPARADLSPRRALLLTDTDREWIIAFSLSTFSPPPASKAILSPSLPMATGSPAIKCWPSPARSTSRKQSSYRNQPKIAPWPACAFSPPRKN